MELHQLKPAKGSNRSERRLARGQGSGLGGTATRGTKGGQSRTGYKRKRKFEGGQTPLQQRVPKRGFNNSFPRYQSFGSSDYVPVNLETLTYFAEKLGTNVFDFDVLYKNGLVSKSDKYKILANGKLNQALEVSADRFSQTAKKAIVEAGGKCYVIFKLSQIQGIVHKYHLKFVNPKTIATYFPFVEESDLIHVTEEGSLTLQFDLSVHKISATAKQQVEANGGKVTVL